MVVAKEKQHVVRSGLLEKEQIPRCVVTVCIFSRPIYFQAPQINCFFFFSLASFFPIFATSDDQGSKWAIKNIPLLVAIFCQVIPGLIEIVN